MWEKKRQTRQAAREKREFQDNTEVTQTGGQKIYTTCGCVKNTPSINESQNRNANGKHARDTVWTIKQVQLQSSSTRGQCRLKYLHSFQKHTHALRAVQSRTQMPGRAKIWSSDPTETFYVSFK